MGKIYELLSPQLIAWMAAQKIFFVATAPLSGEGHINCSPKGSDTFRVLNETTVAYLDLTGSGIETIAHLQENARVVIMFCAFTGAPRIVRLHGKGQVIYPKQEAFAQLRERFPDHVGVRGIIQVTLTRISDSCGYAVPFFDFVAPRDALQKWSITKGEEELAAYREKKNQHSIDNISGYKEP